MNSIDAIKLTKFQMVRKPKEPRGKDTEYGKLMLDLSALLDARELRCNENDEDGKFVMVWHPDGQWPIPFARMERLAELGFVKFSETDDREVDLSLAMPKEKCWYWVRQWDVRGRMYQPSKKETT